MLWPLNMKTVTDTPCETISRVVGLPGDRVVIDEQGTITINGQKLSTSYSDGTTTYVPGQTVFPYTVPEDCYFVLDDNPAGTTDSRSCVYRSHI